LYCTSCKSVFVLLSSLLYSMRAGRLYACASRLLWSQTATGRKRIQRIRNQGIRTGARRGKTESSDGEWLLLQHDRLSNTSIVYPPCTSICSSPGWYRSYTTKKHFRFEFLKIFARFIHWHPYGIFYGSIRETFKAPGRDGVHIFQ
jgi:hypothetical protein